MAKIPKYDIHYKCLLGFRPKFWEYIGTIYVFLNIKLDYEHTFSKGKKTRFKKYIYLNIT